MAMIQGIDANALLNAWRTGRKDRFEHDEAELKLQRARAVRDITGRLSALYSPGSPKPAGVLGQLYAGVDPLAAGGVAGQFAGNSGGGGKSEFDRVTRLESDKRADPDGPIDPVRPGRVLGQPAARLPGIISGYGGGTFDTSGRMVTPPDGQNFDEAFSPDAPSPVDVAADPVAPVQPDVPAAPPAMSSADRRRETQDLIMQLSFIEPDTGSKLANAFRTMDAAELKRHEARNDMMGAAAQYVARGKTPQERMQLFQVVAPQLVGAGWTTEELDGIDNDLSDEKLRGYMGTAIDFDKLLDNERADRRLGQDIADDDADNARADRNTDDLIADREARRTETRRRNDQSDTTRRRGQDVSAETGRRGQDLRGTGGGREKIPTVSTPDEARKLAPGTKFRTPDGRIKIR